MKNQLSQKHKKKTYFKTINEQFFIITSIRKSYYYKYATQFFNRLYNDATNHCKNSVEPIVDHFKN